MSSTAYTLPQLDEGPFLTDGGIETTLIFHEGLDLPCFASFDLLKNDVGTEVLRRYFRRYADLAVKSGMGFVLESPTWRANRDWGERIGYGPGQTADFNRRAIALMHEIRDSYRDSGATILISGNIGPRGDGYDARQRMHPDEARTYHAEQIGVFAECGVDLVSAITITYAEEAIGIVRAAQAAGLPAVIGFTTETDARLPSGQSLEDAIRRVDEAAGGGPAYYMVNCAHVDHFAHALDEKAGWTQRIRGLRANASRLSHAELDESEVLDDGDPQEFGESYRQLRDRLPSLAVFGGCCGTDHRHVEAACEALAGAGAFPATSPGP